MKKQREVQPVKMWAAVVEGKRSSWLRSDCIRRTREEAKAAYLDTWGPQYHKEALKDVRFVKVVVHMAEGQE